MRACIHIYIFCFLYKHAILYCVMSVAFVLTVMIVVVSIVVGRAVVGGKGSVVLETEGVSCKYQENICCPPAVYVYTHIDVYLN